MGFRFNIAKEKCKGCALCVTACARGFLHLAHGLNKKGHHYVVSDDPDHCDGCRKCSDLCPDAAIELEKTDDGDRPADPPTREDQA